MLCLESLNAQHAVVELRRIVEELVVEGGGSEKGKERRTNMVS
jgi:hypothetical protein